MLNRSRRTLVLSVVVLAVCALAATQLRSTASSDLLVGSSSKTGKATAALSTTFGDDPIVVDIKGELVTTLAPENLLKLVTLEGKIARLRGVKVVYGPGTFVNQTIIQAERVMTNDLGSANKEAAAAALAAGKAAIDAGKTPRQAAKIGEQARARVLGPKMADYRDLLVRFGTVGAPALTNRNFVNTLVLGTAATPKRRFQWLFPDRANALILVRPKAGLSQSATLALGRSVKRLTSKSGITPATFAVGGVPLLGAALERETRSELLRIAPLALGVMLLLLLVVLRRRRGRLVPLGVALGGTAIALGASWPLGLGLTVATVAAMPVVLGLGLDFAVQVQSRYWAERTAGAAPEAAALAARQGVGPTLMLAAAAMSVGFASLLFTSVPLLDRLGAFLCVGTLASAGVALFVAPSILVAIDRGPVQPLALGVASQLKRISLTPVALAALAGVAVAGLAVSGQTRLQSDVNTLAPKGLSELHDINALQSSLGTSGQLQVAVKADDVTRADIVEWIGRVEREVLKAEPKLKPGPNIADLVTGGDPGADVTSRNVAGVLRVLPRYFEDAVISRDRHVAQITFGVPLVSVAAQADIVRRVQEELRSPPDGVSAATGGLVAAAASSSDALDSTRPGLLLLAALLVALVLAAAWRSAVRVALVLAPALLAAGVVALLLAIVDLKLSPLGAALEPLVLAVGLEFGMLLDMRYRQARAAGRSPAAARADATIEIGGAVTLSASTVAAGFAVLCASRLSLLTQLGWLVALELGVCLVGALVLVPMLAERLDTRCAGDLPRVPLPSFMRRRPPLRRGEP